MRRQLETLSGTRRKVRVTRPFPSEPRHNGFVVALGQEWVLIQTFHDFYPEGYSAVRVRDVTSVRSGEYERYWERMLAAEGLLDQIATPEGVSLDETPQLLMDLKQRGENVILCSEDSEEAIQDFYIGEILSVNASSVCFANFDGLGRWDPAPHTIRFEEITRVEFDTPYARTFSKYLERPRYEV